VTGMYEGTIRHRRFAVREHAFRYKLALAYVDIDSPPRGFRRSDYLGDAGVPLRDAVHALIRERGAEPPAGPIRLLTMLRSFGVGFNPVSFYYCFGADETLECLVAEVTNTPWGERHAYVLPGSGGNAGKQLHVSPFMGMDHEYEVRASDPGDTASVHIESRRGGRVAFDATWNLKRRPFSRRRLAGASLRTLVLMYGQAIALKVKGMPIHSHPRTEAS
jgi:uncharacterized protein